MPHGCALRMRGPTGAGAIGTGWFMNPRTVLTAGHCAFSNHVLGGWASSIEVIPGLLGAGQQPDMCPYGSITTEQFSSVERWTQSEDPDFDMGCIHLDEPKGDEVGWFALAWLTFEDLAGYLVNVSGHPADRGTGNEQYQASHRLLRVTDCRLFYEVDTFGGENGAPVWVHESEGSPPLAAGIHADGSAGTPSNLGIVANSAPRTIPVVLERLKEWVEQDVGCPEADLPAVRVGRVVDGSGASVPNALVTIVESTVPMPDIALMGDEHGRFSVRLPPGRFTLQADGGGGSGKADVDGAPATDEIGIGLHG